jgi:hypothetical protein
MIFVEKWDNLALAMVTVQHYSSSRCFTSSTWWYQKIGPKHVVQIKSTYKNWAMND